MHVIFYRTLRDFSESKPAYQDLTQSVLAWFRHVDAAQWKSPAHVKVDLGTASILRDGRVVFNLVGNKFRLVVWINYSHQLVYVRFIGTHKQFDQIDSQNI